MNQIKRISRLHKLVELAGGKIDSRKKLHKLVYLVQFSGEDLDQDFIFHNFGVFSPSLANDLDVAKRGDEKVLDETYNVVGYIISTVPDNDESWLADVDFDKKSVMLIRALAEKEPRLLEVLSTIVYLSDNYYSGVELKRKLKSLKPKLTSFYSEAFELAKKHFRIKT